MQGKPNVESWEASKTVWARGTSVKKNASDKVRRGNPSDKPNDSSKRQQWEPFFNPRSVFIQRIPAKNETRKKADENRNASNLEGSIRGSFSKLKWISPKDLQE